jgi:hypothetical protein
MNNHLSLLAIPALLAVIAGSAFADDPTSKPNVIILLSDDQGNGPLLPPRRGL